MVTLRAVYTTTWWENNKFRLLRGGGGTAASSQIPYTYLPGQAVRFGSVVPQVADLGPDDVHAADSAGVLRVSDARFGWVGDDLADAADETKGARAYRRRGGGEGLIMLKGEKTREYKEL